MPITIKKTDQISMVACSQSMHSFLCIGVIQNNMMIPLFEVGKAMPFDKRHRYSPRINGIAILCEALFKCLESEILNERRLIDAKIDGISHTINYVAYEITFENYLQLLRTLRNVNPLLFAYFPTATDHETMTLDYQPIHMLEAEVEKNNPIVKRLKETGSRITFENNCRQAVVDLSYLTRSIPPSPSMPSQFYKPFPCKTTIQNGQFTQKLYLLPAPPSAFLLDHNKSFIIIKLYNKLERIFVSHPEITDDSFDQFESLKALYSREAGKPNQTVHALIETIKAWNTVHPGCLTDNYYSFYGYYHKKVNLVTEIEEKFEAPGFKKLFDKI